jgi:GH15 family glucan-1,4-alpha-glucosidase
LFEVLVMPLAIEEHGVIGNLRTVALVATNGSIDWCCLPNFDSPSVFGALLDDARGGHFQISPTVAGLRTRQTYLPDTNILITRFLHPDGVAEVVDFMPVHRGESPERPHRIVRRVCVVRGALPFRLDCRPAFDYGRARHEAAPKSEGILFHTSQLALWLQGTVPLRLEQGGAMAEFDLRAGERAVFVLEAAAEPEALGARVSAPEVEEWYQQTVAYWRRWLARSRYVGRWREMVHRSALVLKLLTFEPTGALIAAPTTSLPERIGGSRNWDYRYTWIRDASFTLYALLRIGFTEEAGAFMGWLEARCQETKGRVGLQVVYGIDGRHRLEETTLDHLRGYLDSRPVRIGNDAHRQLQLDIYGGLIDGVYLYNKHVAPISYDLWTNVVRLLEWLGRHWDKPDRSMWEIRDQPRQYVSSKVMCWVAMERAMRIARARGLPAPYEAWRQTRDAIYTAVIDQGWNEKRRSFVQHYGSEHLDAGLLLMPMVKFMGPNDPRWLATLERIQEELVTDSLVRRYDPRVASDGLEGEEGTFSACSFWLADCMTQTGRLEEARTMFEKMLTYANHVGLYAEEIGLSGEALGNFPQALTHLALISAAVNLDDALGHIGRDGPAGRPGGSAGLL